MKSKGMFLKHLESHLQSDKIIKAIKKLKGGELKGLPDYEHLNWGSFTKTFKAFNKKHPRINSLEKYAKYVIRHKEDFQRKTLKRAYFYIDIIRKEGGAVKGIDSDSDKKEIRHQRCLIYFQIARGDSDSESNSDEEDGKKARNEINDYLLGFGIKNISTNNIMPKFAKGSEEMINHMKKLREMRGKGVKGSKSKTHKGDLDYTTKKGDKYYHQMGHLVEGEPYMKGGMMKKLSSYFRRNPDAKDERKALTADDARDIDEEDYTKEYVKFLASQYDSYNDRPIDDEIKNELLRLIRNRDMLKALYAVEEDPQVLANANEVNANINQIIDGNLAAYETRKAEREQNGIEGKGFRHRKRLSSGGAVLLPKGHLANKLDLSSYMPRDFNVGLSTTSMMNVPMSRTSRVINAGGIRPPPMLNSSRQRYEGVDDSSRLGAAGNMSFRSLMSL